MDPASMTIDELIVASATLDDRAGGLLDRLARITARASEHGVSVTVNVDGQLIGLELTETALRLDASELAAEIYRLTQQASGAALAEGIATLEPVAGGRPDGPARAADPGAAGAGGGLLRGGELGDAVKGIFTALNAVKMPFTARAG